MTSANHLQWVKSAPTGHATGYLLTLLSSARDVVLSTVHSHFRLWSKLMQAQGVAHSGTSRQVQSACDAASKTTSEHLLMMLQQLVQSVYFAPTFVPDSCAIRRTTIQPELRHHTQTVLLSLPCCAATAAINPSGSSATTNPSPACAADAKCTNPEHLPLSSRKGALSAPT